MSHFERGFRNFFENAREHVRDFVRSFDIEFVKTSDAAIENKDLILATLTVENMVETTDANTIAFASADGALSIVITGTDLAVDDTTGEITGTLNAATVTLDGVEIVSASGFDVAAADFVTALTDGTIEALADSAIVFNRDFFRRFDREDDDTDDTADGDDATDTVDGSTGDDTIDGDDAADTVDGLTGDDTIDGDDATDTVDGSTGDDTVDGDDDLIGRYFGRHHRHDHDDDDADDTIDGDDTDDTIDGDDATDTIDGSTGDDTVDGDDSTDTIDGSTGDDTVDGDDATDTDTDDHVAPVVGAGTDGDDTLTGTDGNDVIRGSEGNDVIDGGLGYDRLYGGNGADSFMFTVGDQADRIYDFTAGEDTIILDFTGIDPAPATPTIEYSANESYNYAVVSYGEKDRITLCGVDETTFTIDDITILA